MFIETSLPLQKAAEVLAGEQSTGTFVRVARESDDVRARFAARVESIDEIPLTGASPLPGAVGDPAARRRAVLRLRFPLDNFGPSLPNLLAAVAGNLFEIKELAAIKLVDLDLPTAFAERYPGPAFGVEGTRRLMSRPDGAMVGTIVKPSIGLSPEELGELVGELAAAGVDFIKDDELQGNGPTAPLAERVRAVLPVLERHADRTGVKPMYAFNITDDIDRLEANHDLVVGAGGTCVMVCINLVGLAGLEYLRRRASVPIHGHRTMFGAISRSEQVGFSFRAWQKLVRLSGADHLHTNGISNKFYRVGCGRARRDRGRPRAAARPDPDGAGAVVRPVGRPRARDVRGGRDDRPARAGRWRHPRSSRRVRRGRDEHARGMGVRGARRVAGRRARVIGRTAARDRDVRPRPCLTAVHRRRRVGTCRD